MIDYKNFIPINQNELVKAMTAFLNQNGAVFENGATDKIHAILPDFHAIMGWNYGYELQPEDWSLVASSKECAESKRIIAETKMQIAGGEKREERPKEISDAVKRLADSKRISG